MNNYPLRFHACRVMVAVFTALWMPLTVMSEILVQEDIRTRLIMLTGDEYYAAVEEALQLPEESFSDLLSSLSRSPEYSLDRLVASILGARAKYPEKAEQFDRHRRHSLMNPDMSARHGRPRYSLWQSAEPPEIHPLIFETLIKVDLPPNADIRPGFDSAIRKPNPNNIPFLVYLTRSRDFRYLAYVNMAVEGHPAERDRVRPVVIHLYKEYRESENIENAAAAVRVLRHFGTQHDFLTLKSLRDYESRLMPKQSLVVREREDVDTMVVDAERAYSILQKRIEQAQQVDVPNTEVEDIRSELADAEIVLQESRRQQQAHVLWYYLEDSINVLGGDSN
jgi:hypothetical protein